MRIPRMNNFNFDQSNIFNAPSLLLHMYIHGVQFTSLSSRGKAAPLMINLLLNFSLIIQIKVVWSL